MLGESISYGTMCVQDLTPIFLDVIRDTPEYVQVMNATPVYAMEDKEADWWNGDGAAGLLESLLDTLDSYSPEGHYFGTHLGNRSNYGFWEMDK